VGLPANRAYPPIEPFAAGADDCLMSVDVEVGVSPCGWPFGSGARSSMSSKATSSTFEELFPEGNGHARPAGSKLR
jgi:hypothetical protein